MRKNKMPEQEDRGCKIINNEVQLLADLKLAGKNYLADLTLSLVEANEDSECLVCLAANDKACMMQGESISESHHTITTVLIEEITEIGTGRVVNLESQEGMLIQQHIQSVLANPGKKFTTCYKGLEFFWLVLDKK